MAKIDARKMCALGITVKSCSISVLRFADVALAASAAVAASATAGVWHH